MTAALLKLGDTIVVNVSQPHPATLRMTLATPASVAYANELLADPDSGWTEAPPQTAASAAFDADGFRAWVLKNLPDDTIIGSSAWWADHLTDWAKRFAKGPGDLTLAARDALSVCDSVSMSRDRRVVRDGCVMYLQTEEWCKWAEQEVAPALRLALFATDPQVLGVAGQPAAA